MGLRYAWRAAVLALAMAGGTAAAEDADDAVDDADLPGIDFLEYLGSWDETDEDWLWVIEWNPDDSDAETEDPDGSGKPESEVR